MSTTQALNPDLLALLASCRAAPADDTPRLVLADWLDEFADVSGLPATDARARSELIRTQVELARPTCDSEHAAHLRATERRLLAANAERWLGDAAARLHELRQQTFGFRAPAPPTFVFDPFGPLRAWQFERGLLTFGLHADELTDPALGAWFGSPLGAWTEEARVRLEGIDALERLAVADGLRPYLGVWYSVGAQVASSMRFNPPAGITTRQCQVLLRSANFGLVRALTLYAPAVGASFLRLMAGADVTAVRRLAVKASVSGTGAAHLAAAPLLNLSALEVKGCDLGAGGLRAIANSPHLAQLVSLTAYRNRFGSDGAAALAASPLAGRLNVLDVQNAGIGDRGIAALANSPLPGRLHGPGLNLSMNPIGDKGAKALAACEHLERFTELVMRECAVADAGAKALANSPHAANLAYLDLWKNRVGDRGAAALAASAHLDDVRELSLRDNLIGETGAAKLHARFADRAKV